MKNLYEWFAEADMYHHIEEMAVNNGMKETIAALPFGNKCHEGQFRKVSYITGDKIPYYTHPLSMACHAATMRVTGDEVFAAILLHDVLEDCNVTRTQLPVSDDVRKIVSLLTRHDDRYATRKEALEAYYDGIKENEAASFIKLLDRCNNVSMMAQCFTNEKMMEYIDETREYIIPLAESLINNETPYSTAAYVLEYQIMAVIDSIDCLLRGTPERSRGVSN